mmetsp:Transcript_16049/g.11579  ORF Transcript_16049/g.11579 Transcript_16049/m.11579 type:complete len:234 (+) Transcript_16049:47-748(+)|eukprot:CAMPEP_0202971332 /NCGR_PEP_ID=MMETSP1396-20130829/26133_1 /ASSEMBLY_ACC=CAM_ASM_000872 /TAXON_ID= /ORGANISM="Pseudokeronopsis sp., Strain Brazil" /LENGTH=233 /DNA_ID=CAMNT_0049700593 /DNA_START=47 /DNA_END=748 /DNA_ORIENTATION=+
MTLYVATHPVVCHKMNALRDATTSHSEFRNLLRELTFYLAYEASRNLNTAPSTVTTPMGQQCTGAKISDNIAIIPILRAGLGMCESMLELFPRASVHHIGMYRTKDSLIPVQYYNRLPRDQPCDVAYVVDPCIATSNTIHAVVNILKRWGAKKVVVIAAIGARTGVNRLMEQHPDVDVHIGAIDEVLSEQGMILPGIGDAGDRQFGTHHDQEPNVLPSEPISPPASNKRKRDA